MANTKISALPTVTTVGSGDVVPLVQSGITKQATVLQLLASAGAGASIVDNGDGTVTVVGSGIVDNGDGTITLATATAGGDVVYTKAAVDTLVASGGASSALLKSANLSDLASTTTARTNLGLDTILAAKADLVGGLIPTAQIPSIALTNAVTVASQAAMLALTTTQVQPGDVAVRTDGAGTFILTATDPTQLGNWVRLNAPTDAVTTVNGQSGTVVLNAANVGADAAGAAAAITPTSLGLGNVTNTSDAAKPVSTAQATAIANTTINLPVNVITTNATAVIGARNAVNASAGPIAVTMPTPTIVGQHMIIERSDTSAVTANTITITGTIRGTANTVVTLAAVGAANEGGHYVAESLTSWAIAGSIKPKAVLDTYYDPKGAAAAIPPGPGMLMQGFTTWPYDILVGSGTSLLISGTLNLARSMCMAAGTITNLYVSTSASAIAGTGSTAYGVVYNASGTQLAVTGDVSAILAGASGIKTLPLTTGTALTIGQEVYLGLMWVSGTSATAPTVFRTGSGGSSVGVGANGYAANRRFGAILSQTTAPSTITPTALAAPGFGIWLGAA